MMDLLCPGFSFSMGTLSIQPPTGVMRNLTEVFLLLRNNSQQSRFIYSGDFDLRTDEKMSLVALDEEAEVVRVNVSTRMPPEWVHYLDEAQYELTKIRSRLKQIREMQQSYVSKPSFTENLDAQKAMDTSTDEVTKMFTHCQRLISSIEKADVLEGVQQAQLRTNVTSTLRLILSNIAGDFRSSQAKFLKQIEARSETINSYLLVSTDWVNTQVLDDAPVDESGDGLSMEHIQMLLKNAEIVKERERDVMSVSRSIVELNSLFKDLSSMIVDQGTVLDQIDYNVEQSTLKVKSALTSIKKAEKLQRNDKKMQCIVILSIAIILLLILLIIVKT